MLVKELSSRLDAFVADIESHVSEAIMQNESKLVTMNRRQMEEGKTASGDLIAPLYRSIMYAKGKKELYGSRAPFRIPDLKLTGAFHRGMKLEIDYPGYFIYSTDEKAEELAEKYDDIFGIAPDYQPQAKEINTRMLAKIFKEKTGVRG